MQERDSNLSTFLSDAQISSINKSVSNWSEDAIIKGLKIRFSVGKHGYNYLRSIGYPTPSYSTLNRRLKDKDSIWGNGNFIHVIKIQN